MRLRMPALFPQGGVDRGRGPWGHGPANSIRVVVFGSQAVFCAAVKTVLTGHGIFFGQMDTAMQATDHGGRNLRRGGFA